MKKFYLSLMAFFCIAFASIAQTVTVGGQCITGTSTLPYAGDVDGKPAYDGTGTVQGISNTQISVFWIGVPDNVWVIAFDGQPYIFNNCNTAQPPGTANTDCTWEPVPGSPCTGAAPLTVTGNVVLPVSLTSFTATASNTNTLLNWQTRQELNNRGFYVQRSADGITWEDLGFVAAATNAGTLNRYSFTDHSPLEGNNYYRLRQVDLDNKQTLSSVAQVSFAAIARMIVKNNPGNGIFELYAALRMETVNYVVFDQRGTEILRGKFLQNETLDLSRKPSGTYWLKLYSPAGNITKKLIKL